MKSPNEYLAASATMRLVWYETGVEKDTVASLKRSLEVATQAETQASQANKVLEQQIKDNAATASSTLDQMLAKQRTQLENDFSFIRKELEEQLASLREKLAAAA